MLGLSAQKGLHEQFVKPFDPLSTRSRISSRFVNLLKSFLLFPDQHRAWRKCLTAEQVQQIRVFNPEIIVSTSSPVTAHNIAFMLSRQMNIPWIADFRDLWSQNHNYQYGKLRRQLDQFIERRLLKEATAIVTVSPGWARDLKDFHHRREVFVVTNGFDPAYTPREKNLDAEHFVMTLTGPVYPGAHNANYLIEAVSICIDEGHIERDSFRIKFLGPHDDNLESLISKYELGDCVEQVGLTSRSKSLAEQWSSDALLLFTWDTDSSKEHLPLRLFEYLATGTPIICTATRHDLGLLKMLDTDDKDYLCFNVEELAVAIGKLFKKWKKGTNGITKVPNDKVSIHSYVKKAEEFSELFSKIIDPDRDSAEF
jgi:glycosyltransferase involved in cell wall biosynthesis